MDTIMTKNFTAKDKFNCPGADALKNHKDEIITVTDVMVGEFPDNDGVLTPNAYLKDENGRIYCSISSAVIRSSMALIEILEETDKVDVVARSKQSQKDREFLILELA